MSLHEAHQGALSIPHRVTWSGQDLTGRTVSAHIQPIDFTGLLLTQTIGGIEQIYRPVGSARASSGTFTLVSASDGVFDWAYCTADVADPGYFYVQFQALYTATYALSNYELWRVKEAI